jgi:hypothetical protein
MCICVGLVYVQKLTSNFTVSRIQGLLDLVVKFQTSSDGIIYNHALMDGILIGYWVALIDRGVEKIKA